MRVLAIRGRNLASLAGDFVIDFEAEPLADAGIFAVTGPTGAGKSTLLDAMCLALFNSLPRLGAAPSSARIETGQGDELSAGDARAILRHGTGEGFAEIDFVGRDGVRYRSRWSVARARQKAGGRMQAAKLAFARLDTGEALGSGMRETLAAIQDVIGLNAEQFRRAVLLAQGDFEAFIRADANERAILLERLTGSSIYARLGRAAWEKAAALKQGLETIQMRIADQNGLDDVGRAAAEAVRDEAQAALDAVQAVLTALDEVARRATRNDELAALVIAAETHLADTAVAQADAAPRREALQRRRTAFAFAGEWAALSTARGALATANEAVALRGQEAKIALGLAEQAERQAQDADRALMAAREAAERLAPAIEQARTLDRQCAEVDAALAKLAEDRAERRQALARHRGDVVKATDAHSAAQATRDAHAGWLARNEALALLAAREDELTGDLADHDAAERQLAALGTERSRASELRAQTDAALRQAEQAQEEIAARHHQAETLLAEALAVTPDDEAVAALDARRDGLAALQPLAVSLHHASERLDAIGRVAARLRHDADGAATDRSAASLRRGAIAGELPALQGALAEARRATALSQAASGEAAMRLRETLVEHQPCPVCGATDHVLGAIDAVLGVRLEADRVRAAELEAEVTRLAREDAILADRFDALTARIARLEGEIAEQQMAHAKADEALDRARATLAASAAAMGLDPGRTDFDAALAELLSAADADRAAAAIARTASSRAQAAELKARQTLDGARNALATARDAAREAVQGVVSLDGRIAHLGETRDRLARNIDAVIGDNADWRVQVDRPAWLATTVAAWRQRSAAHDAAAAALPELLSAVHAAQTASAAAAVRADEIETRAQALENDRADRLTARAIVLDGEAVVDVVARRDSASGGAQAASDGARTALSLARQENAAAIARSDAAIAQAGTCAADLARRDGDFQLRIAAHSLDRAEVEAAMRAGLEAIEAEARSLAALDRACDTAAAALAARRLDLAGHQAEDQPDQLAGEALAEARDAARDAVDGARGRLAEAQFRLRRDDEVRQQTAALRAELERERASARVWLELAELIGDREGRVFRRYAQGLTLDRLLAHANGRLAELKPRYALERGQGGDMLIQVVDHDMAGEVRGVHNLSGGERFLISLALALGLAEMSTGRGLRIESLFIDEGFGALDSASLGQAIGVLEHLHASGRRVGVISHVEEVKERIPVKIEVTPVARGRSEVSVVVD